ncbi:hypothetical protein MKEN_00541300 [Mycena kentingensis (nom. inval.)]|nr:hypothetical protein MKEN_00541300 [Mycena kentingensis (nom. inval.)]
MSSAPSDFTAIPSELLHEIAGLLPLKDQLSFCRINHAVYAQCVCLIYRIVQLADPGRTMKWCRALLMRPSLSVLVKDLQFLGPEQDVFKSFGHALRVALQSLTELDGLTIAQSHYILGCAVGIHFPQLDILNVPWSAHVPSLVEMHRTHLAGLGILPSHIDAFTDIDELIAHGGYDPRSSQSLRPLVLPRLKNLRSSVEIAYAYGAGSPLLTNTRVSWPSVTVVGERHAEFMRALAQAPLVELQNHVYDWPVGIASAIAEYFPCLRSIVVDCMPARSQSHPGPSLVSTDAFLHSIELNLPKFGNLVIIQIMHGTDPFEPEDEDELFASLDRDCTRILRWSELCPHLLVIRLPFTNIVWQNSPMASEQLTTSVWLPVRVHTQFSSPIRPGTSDVTCMERQTMLQMKWYLSRASAAAASQKISLGLQPFPFVTLLNG